MDIKINKKHSPPIWVGIILENAKDDSNGVVAKQFIGAVLARRFKKINIPNHPICVHDKQTDRPSDFAIARLVYYVTSAPSRSVLQKCAQNVRSGLLPVLLIPREQETKARILAQDEGIDKDVAIICIEDFVAMNIMELAAAEDKDFFTILQEIIEIYNQRLAEVETDLSLRIEVH